MSSLYKSGNAVIQGQLTPMIDMIFLLIVFFVLVSRIVDRERVELNLPQPMHAATQPMTDDQRLIVNVLPGATGDVRGYRIGGNDFAPNPAGLAALAQQLAEAYRVNPAINVNVRADRATHYEHVEPVMDAVASAARASGKAMSAARVNLVVVQEH